MKKFFTGLCAALLISSTLLISLGNNTPSQARNTGFSTLAFHVAIEDY